jgi:hypothetical protein
LKNENLLLDIFFALALVNAKPQLDLLKKASDTVTGAFDGCKGKESSFATKPGTYFKNFNGYKTDCVTLYIYWILAVVHFHFYRRLCSAF